MIHQDPFDLKRFPSQEFVFYISAPQNFDGGEEAYGEAVGGAGKADLLACGQGAWRLAQHYAERKIETVVELGAGGGTCSLGLVASATDATVLVTDTSPKFLQMVARKHSRAGINHPRVQLATLAGEDLHKLPVGSTDLIVIASALHHISDWRGFLKDAARALRPGGVLVVQEPCREGNLLMAMALDIVLSPLWPAHAALTDADVARIQRLRDSIYFLNDSALEKIGEDKHVFLTADLAAAGDAAGFVRTAFYANYHFDNLLVADLDRRMAPGGSIINYFSAFLRFHHGLSEDGLSKLELHLFPALKRLDSAFVAGDGVPLMGFMAFCR